MGGRRARSSVPDTSPQHAQLSFGARSTCVIRRTAHTAQPHTALYAVHTMTAFAHARRSMRLAHGAMQAPDAVRQCRPRITTQTPPRHAIRSEPRRLTNEPVALPPPACALPRTLSGPHLGGAQIRGNAWLPTQRSLRSEGTHASRPCRGALRKTHTIDDAHPSPHNEKRRPGSRCSAHMQPSGQQGTSPRPRCNPCCAGRCLQSWR
jgi:hypothetical protein